jgi:hypothetical protein
MIAVTFWVIFKTAGSVAECIIQVSLHGTVRGCAARSKLSTIYAAMRVYITRE